MQRTLFALAILGMLVYLSSAEQVIIKCENDTTCTSGHKLTYSAV